MFLGWKSMLYVISKIKLLFWLAVLSLVSISCNTNVTGVDDSPSPGTVRITLRANPSDNYVVERTDTFSVFTPNTSLGFYVNIFQGSVFAKDKFAILYTTPKSYMQEDSVYNIFKQNTSQADLKIIAGKLDSSKVNINTLSADYTEYTIFESFVPPGNYDKIRFGVNVPTDLTKSRVTLISIKGKVTPIPLELPPDEDILKEFLVDFKVEENKTTQINIIINPFKSISRYKDSYRFSRVMEVNSVEYIK